MESNYTERETVNVPLNPPAREIIDGIREDTGIAKTEALTRLLEWFAAQDRKFRVAVLTKDPDLKRELTRLVLADMAALQDADPSVVQAPPVSIEQATRIIRVMLDHVDRINLSRSNAPAPAGATKRPRR